MRGGGAQGARAIFASRPALPALRAGRTAAVRPVTMEPRIIALATYGVLPPLLDVILGGTRAS